MPDELGYKPAVATEERDVLYRKNVIQRTRTLQTVSVGGMAIIFDPQSGEVFDYIAFEDAKRLLKIGQRTAPGKIQFFTSTVS